MFGRSNGEIYIIRSDEHRHDKKILNWCHDALNDIFDFMNHGDGIVEAVPKGTSKATGIAWLCEHLGVAIEDTYAIGDSINDLEMLAFVGHSIAMGNASQAAKDAAEYVTTHIHEDGIKHALEHYKLI